MAGRAEPKRQATVDWGANLAHRTVDEVAPAAQPYLAQAVRTAGAVSIPLAVHTAAGASQAGVVASAPIAAPLTGSVLQVGAEAAEKYSLDALPAVANACAVKTTQVAQGAAHQSIDQGAAISTHSVQSWE